MMNLKGKINMKNLKNVFKITVTALVLFFGTAKAQNISGHFFGQNAWMPDTVGNANACTDPPCILNGKLHQNWGNIKDSKAQIIRFGGIAPDKNMPTNYQYIRMIDAIRGNGMEPIMQVPFYNNRYTAQQAAEIVNYINKTMGKNVKYWVIGNEPDLAYQYSNAQQVAAYIKPFASAMKAVDPSILIIGPECAWFNKGIIDGLTTPNGPYDITGRDAAGRTYVDIISFHYYAFNGSQSRNDVITKLTSVDNLQDNLAYLNNRLNTCNATHGRTGSTMLKPAVTEANVNWQNPSSDNLSGVGANSFIGGQFIAEMLSVGMKNNVDFINMWSTVEGNNTELNIGYIDVMNGGKKPSYYHFKMVAENFKGTYLNGTTNQPNVKAFGCNNAGNTVVMLMNQDQGNTFNYALRLGTGTVTGTEALKVNINAGKTLEHRGTLEAQSSIILEFNPQGVLVKSIEYSLMKQALANKEPLVLLHESTSIPVTGLPSDQSVVDLKGFNVKMFPNPAKNKFTIELDRNNPQQAKFDIDIFDIMGRLIYNRTTTFLERKQELDLEGNSLAEAVYIVRVREAEDKDNVRTNKMVLFK
jgi:hypothetical protein